MPAGGRLIVTHPGNGETAACGNGHTLGFLAPSTDAVDAWHAAGVANGGPTAEDPPGGRHATEGRTVSLAYLRAPAGNTLGPTPHTYGWDGGRSRPRRCTALPMHSTDECGVGQKY